MSRKNSYAYVIRQGQEERLRAAAMTARMQTLDKATIALGEMGLDPDKLAEFEDTYLKVEHDYCEEVLADDNDLWYARDRIDRKLKEYVRPDRFAPYSERYAK